jgi:hypothetical protein
MATQSSFCDADPRIALSRTHELTRRVRRSQRATWFPLLVFAVLTFVAIPVNRFGHRDLTCTPVRPDAFPRVCLVHNSAAFVYWPIALVVAYVLIAAFYIRQSHRRGVGTRVLPYVAAGLVIAVALSIASAWAVDSPISGQYDVLAWHLRGADIYRLIGPACAIGIGLLVLSAVERNVALLAVTAVYLVVALGGVNLGWTLTQPTRWSYLPNLVIEGGVLLIAAIGFAVAQRPDRPGAA